VDKARNGFLGVLWLSTLDNIAPVAGEWIDRTAISPLAFWAGVGIIIFLYRRGQPGLSLGGFPHTRMAAMN